MRAEENETEERKKNDYLARLQRSELFYNAHAVIRHGNEKTFKDKVANEGERWRLERNHIRISETVC